MRVLGLINTPAFLPAQKTARMHFNLANLRATGARIPVRSGARLAIFLLASLLLQSGRADVTIAPLFQAQAVLQRELPVPVWGQALPGEAVTVEFAGQCHTTTADTEGRWRIILSPLTANATGTDLRVSGRNRIVVPDVLVGEVWLCSGQSNMEWPLKNDPAAAKGIPAARRPTLRQFKVERRVRDQPDDALTGSWSVCSPTTAGSFTAVGYHFALHLQVELGVPVGLINSSYGATAIEAWLPPTALAQFPEIARRHESIQKNLPEQREVYEQQLTDWRVESATARSTGQVSPRQPRLPTALDVRRQPGGLFNGMIAALSPFACRGILWYQGESNTGRAGEYARFFPALIEGWRHAWARPELPFLFVQLPNYRVPNDQSGVSWAELRAAQLRGLELPGTGVVIAVDLGVANNGHPPDKSGIGQRLARLALAQVYHAVEGDATGPLFAGATAEGPAVRVRFQQVQSGLEVRSAEPAGFELAGDDRVYHPASAKIEDRTVLVSALSVPVPKFVRYAWSNNPAVSLYNGAGLPASPFAGPVN